MDVVLDRPEWGIALFKGSEWFQRGWTLQELLAPRNVEFYNKNWAYLGDKHALKTDITLVTDIGPDVLEGKTAIQDIDVRTKMQWALARETTIPVDKAYCLMGILGVSIDPDYGENIHTAFKRLHAAFTNAYSANDDGDGLPSNNPMKGQLSRIILLST
ncbi:37S ribosomal protein S22 [Stygiomarasmius scandens]|uniref:37S ribosomal protein S22 n=1 Tax=Marasmiellus scandens TaxID=2682957 RepID=A0ABR1IVJ6_9AGAR